jgi:hypothetical protein
MKKNFALALALTVALSSTVPVFAFTRDGGGGRDRGWDPIDRVVKIIKKLLKASPLDGLTEPHP